MQPFSERLSEFIHMATWTYARTMPEWPHVYIVKKNVDAGLFVEVVRHIREHGYQGSFYQEQITYYDQDGLVYWTMGATIEETTIINRCREEGTYENRLKNGTLPDR